MHLPAILHGPFANVKSSLQRAARVLARGGSLTEAIEASSMLDTTRRPACC